MKGHLWFGADGIVHLIQQYQPSIHVQLYILYMLAKSDKTTAFYPPRHPQSRGLFDAANPTFAKL